ncbi:MAG: gamma-glutamylcyclotransferase [Thermoanaerobaculia bacterium]|nr:gamma-glutamylcyclotransferase [Thermoanaerobaculia bacterium]
MATDALPEATPGLIAALRAINRRRRLDGARGSTESATLADDLEPAIRRQIEGAHCRLAVYGTLAPGKANHHLVEPLRGSWRRGEVRGSLHPHGWGATLGFPALVWDPAADPIGVDLLESPALASAWPELDAFEGEAYLRILVPVASPRHSVEPTEVAAIRVANLYASRAGPVD